MKSNADFRDLLRFLNEEKAEYLIVGAYAVIYYTEPRYTKDIDILVNPKSSNAKRVYAALKKFGAPLKALTPEDLTNSQMVYQIGVEPNRIDVLMGISGVAFDKAWKNKKVGVYDDEKVYIIDLESLIKAKKAAGRPQDKLDLEKLKKVEKTKNKSS